MKCCTRIKLPKGYVIPVTRQQKGTRATGLLRSAIQCRNLSMEVKKGLLNNTVLPKLMYKSEMWTGIKMITHKIRAFQRSYLRDASRT